MKRKFVYNYQDDIYTGDIISMLKKAIKNKYKFFLFNHKIYFIYGENAFYTGITKADLM